MTDRHTLIFSRSPLPLTLPSLPTGITRTFIPTPHGPLELLIASPPTSQTRKQALLFQHGGFGFASEWHDFMLYFSHLGYPCYAISLRGHGCSWQPGYWKMTWWFGKSDFAEDLMSTVGFVRGVESGVREFEGDGRFKDEDLVLLGHSAGGGLSQYFLGREKVRVGALVVMGGFPCFGGYGVYWNWFKMDPWFAPRYYLRDLWHSRSPLSSTTLVHNAFLSPECPLPIVRNLERGLCEYESMIWPLGMMFPLVNVQGVVRSIVEWKRGRKNLLVVAGEKDVLMTPTLMSQMTDVYEGVVRVLFPWLREKEDSKVAEDEDENEDETDTENVGFEVVSASGHHFQNDIHWEEAAQKIEKFLEQL